MRDQPIAVKVVSRILAKIVWLLVKSSLHIKRQRFFSLRFSGRLLRLVEVAVPAARSVTLRRRSVTDNKGHSNSACAVQQPRADIRTCGYSISTSARTPDDGPASGSLMLAIVRRLIDGSANAAAQYVELRCVANRSIASCRCISKASPPRPHLSPTVLASRNLSYYTSRRRQRTTGCPRAGNDSGCMESREIWHRN